MGQWQYREGGSLKAAQAATAPARSRRMLYWTLGVGAVLATAITLGVVFATKGSGSSSSSPASQTASADAVPVPAPAAPAPAPIIATAPNAIPNAAAAPAVVAAPSPTPTPVLVSPSPPPMIPSPPLLPSPPPLPRKLGIPMPPPTPPAPGMFIFPVDPQFQGTCALKQAGSTQRCVDYMDNGAQLPGNGSALQPMEDASMAEACGFIPVSQVLPTLYSWAFKGANCHVDGYTIVRACVNGPDGQWRTRTMLWSSNCPPLCIKIRGMNNTAVDYGRTASC